VLAALYVVINVGGAAVAIASGQWLHAGVHFVLLLPVAGAYLIRRPGLRSRHEDLPRAGSAEERLENLQQSLDAIALEVERIGEAQRFHAKLVAERLEASRPKQQS
jgi:hypothetical protein